MVQVIKTKKREYTFVPIEFYYGQKKIDKYVAKKNLLDTAAIFSRVGIRFGLIYGTLLGAVRDNDFIEWDEDVDLFVMDEDRATVLETLDELEFNGFKVARYSGDLLSIIRNDDYIDLYFFRRSKFGYRVCGRDKLPSRYFKNFQYINFLGTRFPTLDHIESFLMRVYGEDWRIPKKNYPADARGCSSKFKDVVSPYLPECVLAIYRKFRAR